MSKFINVVSNDPTHIAMETVSDINDTLSIIFESYDEAKSIWDQLSSDDKLLVTPSGRFVDSPIKIFQYIHKVKNKPVGFIEAYKYNGTSTTSAFLVYAILKEFRNKGISKILLNKAVEGCKKEGYKYLIYRCEKENKASYNAARSFGFELRNETKNQYSLRYEI